MKRHSTVPTAPKDLKPAGRALWSSIADMFVLEPHHERTLYLACVQTDRAAAAKKLLDAGNLTVTDRFGQLKQNPLVEVERQAALAAVRLVRELGVDTAAAESAVRTYSRRGA